MLDYTKRVRDECIRFPPRKIQNNTTTDHPLNLENHWHHSTALRRPSFLLQQLVQEVYLALQLLDSVVLVFDDLTASEQLLQRLLVLFLVVDCAVRGREAVLVLAVVVIVVVVVVVDCGRDGQFRFERGRDDGGRRLDGLHLLELLVRD